MPPEDYNEMEHKIDKYSIKFKREVMSNQCLKVLDNKMANDIELIKIASSHLWRSIMPIIWIKGFFINERGQQMMG